MAVVLKGPDPPTSSLFLQAEVNRPINLICVIAISRAKPMVIFADANRRPKNQIL